MAHFLTVKNSQSLTILYKKKILSYNIMILTKQNFIINITAGIVSNEQTLITNIVSSFKTSLYPQFFTILHETPTDNQLFAKIQLNSLLDNKLKANLNDLAVFELSNSIIENADYTITDYEFEQIHNKFSSSYLFFITNNDVGNIISQTVDFKFNNDAAGTYLFPTNITFMKIDETISCTMDLSQSLQPCRNQTGATSRWLEGTLTNVPARFLPKHENIIYSTDCNTIFLSGSDPNTNIGTIQNSVLFIQKSGTSIIFKLLPVPIPGTATAPSITTGMYVAFGGTWNTVATYAKRLIFSYNLI